MKGSVKSVIKHVLNIAATLLCGSVAFIFAIMGLSYRSTDFIAANQAEIASVTFGLIFILVLLYVLLYLFDKKTAYRLLLFILAALAIFAVIFYLLCYSGLIKTLNSIQSIRDLIQQAGGLAVLIFVAFQFLQVVVLPVPGSVSVAAGVALFGPFECTVFSFIGILLGSFLAFAIGRLVGVKAVQWIVGKETLEKWLKKVKGKDYLILSIMFLLPFFPDDILCFVAGLSSMTWGYFFIMITVTRAISIAATAYSVGFIPLNTWWGVAIWVAIIALIGVLVWLVFKYADEIDKFLKKKLKIKEKSRN